MTAPTLLEAWSAAFGEALPAGYLCRAVLRDRWMRIHSLPESKRYPETKAERDEILRRHNAAACCALGDEADCMLFIVQFGDSRDWADYRVSRSRYTREFLLLSRLDPEYVQTYEGGQDGPIQFFGTRQRWRAGAFDKLILMCAEATAGPYLFANTDAHSKLGLSSYLD